MEILDMSHNNLTGPIFNLQPKLLFGPLIFLNSNQFEVIVPSFLLQASFLLLNENKFSYLPSFCEQRRATFVMILDLSNNAIEGQLPDCWNSVHNLRILDLSHNELSGKIPESMGSLVHLNALVLRNNNLMGEFPSTLKNCSYLVVLDVRGNILSGSIPSWIGESMNQLVILNMQQNNFSGSIPNDLCNLKHLQLLDLSWNMLSKGIPTCLKNLTAMSEQGFNGNTILYYVVSAQGYMFFGMDAYMSNIRWMWKGVEHEFKIRHLSFKSIDLSSNNLTGEIPKEIGYLVGLVSLNLSRNNLSGKIPSEMGNLSFLESLDLQRNHISGEIPFSLSEIDFLGILDLSHNSLSGRIPSGRHFETFDVSSFEGNVGLCGEQLNKTCSGDGNQTTIKPHEHGIFYEAFYISMGIGYFIGFWGLLGPKLLWRPWRNYYIRFVNRLINYIYAWFW
ncbi:receptor-like protein EIX2 [Vigna unguiculata]|uniref:receptor-like protein EIX2 n=1 Tax=Vigna unguiculata TaxID=3917 RepID=UPI0010169DA6|nr:receptor-like protein EIX2 [Vigna unguiculata]XP_027924061.1 receptor-like protein EIX2 [Vigna unguiculata]